MKAVELRFSACRILPQQREIYLQGQLQPIEPKPFELLVYLITHRQRVVSQDELLDALWADESVSLGVVTRAVMKARQAIGDEGKESRLIKTVHRKGYRFTGTLEAGDASAAEQNISISPARAPHSVPDESLLSIALLPFENRTGLKELAWVGLGLLSMVARALASDDRLMVAPVSAVLLALDAASTQSTAEARMKHLQRLLGVHHVIHTAVVREGNGFGVECRIEPGLFTHIHLKADELPELGRQLARGIEARLFPKQEKPLKIALSTKDPTTHRDLMHALQSAAEQKWADASDLFQLVLDREPGNDAVRIEQLFSLAALGDDSALTIGLGLLDDARRDGDEESLARIHLALGQAYHHKRLYKEAKPHLEQAFALSAGREQKDWVATPMLLRSSIAIVQLDLDGAAEWLELARRHCDRSGSQVDRLGWILNSGLHAAKSGDLVHAMQFGRDAVRLCQEHRLKSYFALTSVNLAHAMLGLGLMHEAAKHAEESFSTSQTLSERFRTASAGDTLSLIYSELRQPAKVARAVEILRGIRHELTPAAQFYELMSSGHLARGEQRHDEAVAYFEKAVSQAMRLGIWLQAHEGSPWLVRALVRAGRSEEATAISTTARDMPEASRDAELHAALRHGKAMQLHARGEHAQACTLLQEVASTAPPGMWRAYACIDGAWLCLERGELESARALSRGMGAWLHEHPAGMALDARLKFESGQFQSASLAQRRYATAVQRDPSGYFDELQTLYRRAALQDSSLELPRAPWLPTLI